MAVEYSIGCKTCKEFIDVMKLKLVDDIQIEQYGIEGLEISGPAIMEGFEQLKKDLQTGKAAHWITEFMSDLHRFIDAHAHHEMRLLTDTMDYPWEPEYEGYCEWKEFKSHGTTELFLPRNLIEDLNIERWEEAKAYLQTLKIWLYEDLELLEYQTKFHLLLETKPS